MDGDVKTAMTATTVDAPELGKRVELVEGSVGDVLDLVQHAKTATQFDFLLRALAISLRVDGRAFTFDELRGLPGRQARALLRIGGQAITMNSFFADEEDDAPKS